MNAKLFQRVNRIESVAKVGPLELTARTDGSFCVEVKAARFEIGLDDAESGAIDRALALLREWGNKLAAARSRKLRICKNPDCLNAFASYQPKALFCCRKCRDRHWHQQVRLKRQRQARERALAVAQLPTQAERHAQAQDGAL